MQQEKILFEVQRDDEGFPPCDIEGVWATETVDGCYVLDNIPFFAREATYGDMVQVRREGGEYFYHSTIERSGNSLFRIMLYGDSNPEFVMEELQDLGCQVEQSHIPELIAVGIPPNADFPKIKGYLDHGCQSDKWDYEEAILRH